MHSAYDIKTLKLHLSHFAPTYK